MPHIAVDVDCQISCTATNVTHRYAHLALLLCQNDFSGCQWVQDELLNFHTRCTYTLTQIISGGCRGSDDMRFHFETITMHPSWVTDAVLTIHAEAALNHVGDLAVVRNCHRARLIEGMFDVELFNHVAIHSRRPAAIYR